MCDCCLSDNDLKIWLLVLVMICDNFLMGICGSVLWSLFVVVLMNMVLLMERLNVMFVSCFIIMLVMKGKVIRKVCMMMKFINEYEGEFRGCVFGGDNWLNDGKCILCIGVNFKG